MALIWVPSMMDVKMAKSNASKPRKSNRTTVAGGLYEEHSFHSLCTHVMNCRITNTSEWIDSVAM